VTPLGWALLALAAVAAVADWAAVWSGGPRARSVERVAKPAALLALIALAVVTPPAVPAVQAPLVAALAAGLVGDVLLLPPGRLVPGLVAFLVGHLAYIAAFALLPGSPAWLVLGLAIAAVVGATVGRALVRAAARSGLAVPVAVYLVAISAMAVMATRTSIPAAILGAWLFVASDAMLGWGEFAEPPGEGRARGGRRLRLGVITTYHLGQALLTLALLLGG
jgi:uncharacterized membrane protein YhhN